MAGENKTFIINCLKMILARVVKSFPLTEISLEKSIKELDMNLKESMKDRMNPVRKKDIHFSIKIKNKKAYFEYSY